MDKNTIKFIENAEAIVEKQGIGATKLIKCLDEEEHVDEERDIVHSAVHFKSNIDFYVNSYLYQFQCKQRDTLLKKWLLYQENALKYVLSTDVGVYTYWYLERLLGYLLAYMLASRIDGAIDYNIGNLSVALLPAFWEKFKTDDYANSVNREYYQAVEMIFDYLNQDYENVILKFEKSGADLLKYESHCRTIMKLCMYLSKQRQGDTNDNTLFGADTMMALVQYQYYLYLVKDTLTAKRHVLSRMFQKIIKVYEILMKKLNRVILNMVQCIRYAVGYTNLFFGSAINMSKLVYGIEEQIKFKSEKEKKEALDFLRSRSKKRNVEQNQLRGARGPEHRFYFGVNESVPKCLERQLTSGRRINCKELYEEVYGDSE